MVNDMLLKGKHIFIVEDNVQNRVIFQMTLVRHGALVDFERLGNNTVYRLKNLSRAVDLIILDLMLANAISGFTLIGEIRALANLAAVPIIAVSAMDPAIAIPEARAKGFTGFIAKPINNKLFPQQIARIINGEQIWSSGERWAT